MSTPASDSREQPQPESVPTLSSVVSWSDHRAILLEAFTKVLKTGRYSDLTLRVQDRAFSVHRVVLGAFTDYFDACDGLWMHVRQC